MNIYLIRHGDSTGNGTGCFLGWSDHSLTDRGRAQAEAAAERLADLGPMPVFCSDLQRARATAEIIAVRWQGTVMPDARWREINCGDFEGCPWDDLSRDAELSQRFDEDPLGACMPGGESVAMMAERVVATFTELRAHAEEHLAVVTHGGPIRAVLAHCLRIPPERYWALDASHGGITHLVVTDDWLTVRTVNDISHLAGVCHV